jgi:uncharacterized protein
MNESAIAKELNPTEQEVLKQVTALLEGVSMETGGLSKATGMHCKPGCGKCCQVPYVETTVTEMMPLAVHLWAEGTAEDMLAKIEERTNRKDTLCILFQADPVVANNGRCGGYQYRPGICRLFGYAVKKSQKNEKQLVTCQTIKTEFPDDYAKALEHIAEGKPVALMGDFSSAVSKLDPLRGSDFMPINDAIRIAIERVGMALHRPHFS